MDTIHLGGTVPSEPVMSQQPMSPQPQQPMSSPMQTQPVKSGGSRQLLLIVAIVILVALAVYGAVAFMPKASKPAAVAPSPAVAQAVATVIPPEPAQKPSEYQAVFLNNSQVYFGKVQNSYSSQFVQLADVYYLKVQDQAAAPASKGKKAAPAQSNISLVKLGGELHGPTDKMSINRDQILLIEDLREDSKLLEAIQNYKAAQVTPAPVTP